MVSAASAGDALLLAERLGPAVDLVVTDVVMPLLEGPRLLERIGGRRAVYMSGYLDSPTLRELSASPTVTLLAKPFTAGDLLRSVRDALAPAPLPSRASG